MQILPRAKWWAVRLLRHRPSDRATLHDYWRDPPDPGNRPEDYLHDPDGEERSRFLVDLLSKHAPGASVLELGCNVGRNLHYLHEAGFGPLGAIEINENALQQLRAAFPALAAEAALAHGTLESELPKVPGGDYDVVFSMAVLEHVHYESDWLMAHVVRSAKKFVVTIENEYDVSDRTFPRNYQRVLERHGARQVEVVEPVPGLPVGFIARVLAVTAPSPA